MAILFLAQELPTMSQPLIASLIALLQQFYLSILYLNVQTIMAIIKVLQSRLISSSIAIIQLIVPGCLMHVLNNINEGQLLFL